MNRRTFARTLLVSGVISLAGKGTSFAQEADIKAAVNAYHAAIGTLDISKMDSLCAHDANVMLINPRDKSIAIGWDAVKKDWEANWSNYSALKVTQVDGPHIAVKGDVAWSTGIARAEVKMKDGNTVNAPTFETDVFEKHGNQWLLVLHTAARVPQ